MTKKILIIDPFVKQPVNNCFNRLVDLLPARLYLYQPAFFPMDLYTVPLVDAYIVLGSATHISEKLSWHFSLKDFLLSELKANKPVLGLCFGHQLLGHAFGGNVDFLHQDQGKLLGSRIIAWENNQYALGITHRQAVTSLSSHLTSLMPQNTFGYDLIQHNSLPFLGCQAHPEASEQFLSHDCQIQDYSQRQNILQDSGQFLMKWYQKFVQ